MADLDNLIDSKISLISHQDVRYDGTLFSINTSESSIVLKDVKCLGTEGRVSEESKKVPATQTIIPFVTFPGQEIKDLYVHEEPAAPAPQVTKKHEPRVHQNQQNNTRAPQRSQQGNNDNRDQNRRQQSGARSNAAPQQQQHQRREQAPRQHQEARTSVAGTGAHLLNLREKKTGGDQSEATKENTKSVFDFEAGLSVFKKDEVLAKVATEGEGELVPEERKYKKDDFFDMMSTDRAARDDPSLGAARMTASQERSLNQDTFGAIALQGGGHGYRRNYNRNGGRGRGGRGRGRGYGNGGVPAN